MKSEGVKLGICMEGNEPAFMRALETAVNRYRKRRDCLIPDRSRRRTFHQGAESMDPFVYLEIGVASGHTLGAVTRALSEEVNMEWATVGIDIQGGWSLNVEAVRRTTGVGNFLGCLNPFGDVKLGEANVSLSGSQKFLHDEWNAKIDMAFVDGCHGAPCVRADFIAVARYMRKGGIVVFHDSTPGCQGQHIQPHCGTPIAVRQALEKLGLLQNSLPGWKMIEETNAPHGIAIIEYVGLDAAAVVSMPDGAREGALFGSGGFTPAVDVKLLRFIAGQAPQGAILEIGCNEGQTTLELAKAFPDRHVHGVDFTGGTSTCDITMCGEQAAEGRPSPETIGRQAASLPNVTILDANSQVLDWSQFKDVTVIFIDGDHSYSGVSKDTEKALDYLRESAKGGFIVWHDYSPTHPHWVGVKRYVDAEIAPFYDAYHVEGSWIAAVFVEGRGKEVRSESESEMGREGEGAGEIGTGEKEADVSAADPMDTAALRGSGEPKTHQPHGGGRVPDTVPPLPSGVAAPGTDALREGDATRKRGKKR